MDEMASNVMGDMVKLTDKNVHRQRLCIALSKNTVCHSYDDGWSVEE